MFPVKLIRRPIPVLFKIKRDMENANISVGEQAFLAPVFLPVSPGTGFTPKLESYPLPAVRRFIMRKNPQSLMSR
jgi:hypothetical protein